MERYGQGEEEGEDERVRGRDTARMREKRREMERAGANRCI